MAFPTVNISASATDPTPVGSVTTGAVTTTGGAGSLFLVFVQSRAPGNTPTDSKGNTYTALSAEITQSFGGTNYYNRVWKCAAGTGGTSHTATATNQNTGDPRYITAHFVEVLGDSGVDIDGVGAWLYDTAANFVSDTISPSVAEARVFAFNTHFSLVNPTTWTHAADGFSAVTSYTNGAIGPCSQVQSQQGSSGNNYQSVITATSARSAGGVQLFVFTVGAAAANPVRGLRGGKLIRGGMLLQGLR